MSQAPPSERQKHETAAPQGLWREDPEQADAEANDPDYEDDIAIIFMWPTAFWPRVSRFLCWWNRNRTLNLLTLVIASTTIVYSFFSYQQWQTMQRQLDLSQRPWMSLDLMSLRITSPLTFNDKGGFITIAGEMKNTGHSVAMHTMSHIRIVDVSELPRGFQMHTARMCDAPRSPQQTVGYMLFPGDVAPITEGAELYPDDIAHGLVHSMIKGRLTPVAIVCIQYQSAFETKYHLSQYIFLLLTQSNVGMFVPKSTIPDLHLAHTFFGDLAD